MKFKVGFATDNSQDNDYTQNTVEKTEAISAVKSVVSVHFEQRNMTLPYYNDRFDLHCGDIVFVDGKLEGLRGRVIKVTYNFKIKLSDYQRVTAVADTAINGELFMAKSHLLSFNSSIMPYSKVRTWFMPPEDEDEQYNFGSDDNTFVLDELGSFNISPETSERGMDYYADNKVVYLCVDGNSGKAVVIGTKPYTVEFEYISSSIKNLVCDCYCNCNCKHEFAAMLQLREVLAIISEKYLNEYDSSGYFAALSKSAFMSYVLLSKDNGSITLN